MLLFIAMIANTIEATPLKPAQETRIACEKLILKGDKRRKMTKGLATKVKNRNI